MPHTEEEIERAVQLAEEFEPDLARTEDTSDLREIAVAADQVKAGEARLREAIELARAHGRSWNHIAIALGVSRQAARQRFADKTPA